RHPDAARLRGALVAERDRREQREREVARDAGHPQPPLHRPDLRPPVDRRAGPRGEEPAEEAPVVREDRAIPYDRDREPRWRGPEPRATDDRGPEHDRPDHDLREAVAVERRQLTAALEDGGQRQRAQEDSGEDDEQPPRLAHLQVRIPPLRTYPLAGTPAAGDDPP